MKRLLIVSSLFPNPRNPTRGVFIKQAIAGMLRYFDMRVVSPIPWTHGWWGKKRIRKGTVDGIPVDYPRYFFTPKVGRSLYGFFFFLSLIHFIRTLFRKFAWDAMIVHWAYPDAFGMVLANRFIKRPLFVFVLGSDINIYTQSRLRRRMILYALREATHIFSVAYQLADKMVALGIDPHRISVISRGIDFDRFYPRDKKESRLSLALPMEKKIVLFVGGLVEVKGLPTLLEAALLLRKRRNDLLFLLVGGGHQRGALEKIIAEQGAEEAVRLVGEKPHTEIPVWIGSCDLFCLPSLNEGRPNVVMEALACGRPVVGSDVGDIGYLVRLGTGGGAVVPPQDSVALAGAIGRALDASWDPRALSESVSELTWEACARKIHEEVMQRIDPNGSGL
jgi:glycosyltransferase involved in cell wall biosynthesis